MYDYRYLEMIYNFFVSFIVLVVKCGLLFLILMLFKIVFGYNF